MTQNIFEMTPEELKHHWHNGKINFTLTPEQFSDVIRCIFDRKDKLNKITQQTEDTLSELKSLEMILNILKQSK